MLGYPRQHQCWPDLLQPRLPRLAILADRRRLAGLLVDLLQTGDRTGPSLGQCFHPGLDLLFATNNRCGAGSERAGVLGVPIERFDIEPAGLVQHPGSAQVGAGGRPRPGGLPDVFPVRAGVLCEQSQPVPVAQPWLRASRRVAQAG